MERRVLTLVKSRKSTYRVPQRVRGHKLSIRGLQQRLKLEIDLRFESNMQTNVNTTRHGLDTYMLDVQVTIAAPLVTASNIPHFFHLGKFFGSHGSPSPSNPTTVNFSLLESSIPLSRRSFSKVCLEVVDILKSSLRFPMKHGVKTHRVL
jgi:hypothetical protein